MGIQQELDDEFLVENYLTRETSPFTLHPKSHNQRMIDGDEDKQIKQLSGVKLLLCDQSKFAWDFGEP